MPSLKDVFNNIQKRIEIREQNKREEHWRSIDPGYYLQKESNKRLGEIEWERLGKILKSMGYSPITSILPDWLIESSILKADHTTIIRELTKDVKPPLAFLTIWSICDAIWPPKQYFGNIEISESATPGSTTKSDVEAMTERVVVDSCYLDNIDMPQAIIDGNPELIPVKIKCTHCQRIITNDDDGCCSHCGAPIDYDQLGNAKWLTACDRFTKRGV